MAKYTSNGNLIQGAATAYKNYDNAPGMYAGLDKVIDQGNKVFEEQMEKRRVVEKKFDDASEGVLMRSGALGKTLYGTATEDAKKFRELYIEGINTKDPNKKMEAMVGLQGLSDFVQDHKQTNLDIAKLRSDGDLSSYYEKNPKGREDAHLITQILEQSYSRVSENEEGEKVFHVKGTDGKEVMISNKEYKEMSSTLKNYNTGNGYIKTSDTSKKDEIWNEDTFRQGIKQVIPKNKGEFKAAAYDDISGTNLVDMLNDSKTLDQEIISAIDPKAWDADGDKFLDKEEKEAFIDAVTNVDNDFFNLGVSNQILEDQLTNAGLNSHTKHWKKINDEKAIKEQKLAGPIWKQKGYANEGAYFKALKNTGTDSGGLNQLNPFGSSAADYVDDGSAKGVYQPFGTRNNKRRTIMNIVQNKPGAGEKFVGVLGDYIWNGKMWSKGEELFSTIDMMKDEKTYYAGGDFENNLTKKQIEVKPLELSEFGDAPNAKEVFSKIKTAYENKNKAIEEMTGVRGSGALKVREFRGVIYVMVDGKEKKFKLGDSSFFMGTSKNEKKRMEYLTTIEKLLNTVNSSLDTEYVNTNYNSMNNTETN